MKIQKSMRKNPNWHFMETCLMQLTNGKTFLGFGTAYDTPSMILPISRGNSFSRDRLPRLTKKHATAARVVSVVFECTR